MVVVAAVVVVVCGCLRLLLVAVGCWLLAVRLVLLVLVLPLVNALDFRYFLQAEEQAVPAVDNDSFSSQADRSFGVLYADSRFPCLQPSCLSSMYVSVLMPLHLQDSLWPFVAYFQLDL